MFSYSSLELVILLVTCALNGLLAVFVYLSNPKSATNKVFALLSFFISAWLLILYLSNNASTSEEFLFWARLSIALATPMNFSFYLLASTLPSQKLQVPIKRLFLFTILTLAVVAVALSPFAFTDVFTENNSFQVVSGVGMLPFSALSVLFTLLSGFSLIKKYRTAPTIAVKQQLRYVIEGVLIMLTLLLGTILLPVLVFSNHFFILFSPLYTLIFLGMTAYAIVKHHLFNIKVIATEALTSILGVLLFAKMITSTTPAERAVDVLIFVGTLIFSIFLIRSVRNEVRQREQLEVLTKQLEDANEKLQALDKARADFITIASHQLRTPPATIKWYLASILSGDYGDVPDEAKEQIVKANVTNNGLISLIDDLLNASRIERGKMEFFFEKNNMEPVAKSVFDQLEPMAIMKNLKLVYNKPATPLPDIIFDKEKIRQVINNFIDNAIKYTKTGVITINMCVDKENAVRVSVTDTGKGIAPDVALSIFEKYTRGKDSVTHSTGLGLGLYVAKIIVEQHHGKIWAESPGVGQGSTFVFSIPIANKLEATTFDLVEQKQ